MTSDRLKEGWKYSGYWDSPDVRKEMEKELLSEYDYVAKMVFSLLPKNPSKIIDLGSGNGARAKVMQERGHRVFCTEVDPFAVKECLKKGLPAKIVDLETRKVPAKSGTFEAATCFEVIEHLKNPSNLFSEAYRLLEPNGLFIISTPNINWWWMRTKHLFGSWDIHASDHIRFYSPASLKECLREYGFEVTEERYYHVIPHIAEGILPALKNFSYSFAFKCKRMDGTADAHPARLRQGLEQKEP